MDLSDLQSVSRDVERADRAWRSWRRDPVANADDDPASRLRHVAGQSTYDALATLTTSAALVPLRDAIRRWVYALLQRRIGRDLEVALAKSEAEPRGRYEGEIPRAVSWREAWRGVAEARATGEASLWLDAAKPAAPAIGDLAREQAARRLEVARRLGLEHPAGPLSPAKIAVLHDAARDLLGRTNDLALHVLREALPRGARPSLVDAVALTMARDAGDGWPPRLSARWLEETFGAATRGLSLERVALPEALGAASFARALSGFGFALREAMTPRGLPFPIAHDPWPTASHRMAALFGALPCDAQFHLAILGTSRRVAIHQARALAKTALFDVRLAAARVLLSDERAFAPRDRFEEITQALYGDPLPSAFAGAWPRAREDEPARFAGLVSSLPLARDLVDRFDVDWFRNPRVWAHLRASSAGPAHETEIALDTAALARAFEEALA